MLSDILLVPFGASYAQMREAALVVEEAGFNGLWTFDHLRDPQAGGGGVPECWTVLSALAEATSRIQLGPLVLNVINRRPGLLANMAATLQEVSRGRLVLGIGAGGGPGSPYSLEQEALGELTEIDRVRARRVAEAAQVLRLLWTADAPSFAGRHYQLRAPAGFLRPNPGPPLVIAGFGPRMATIAGRYGDGFNTLATNPSLAALVERARSERRASGGTLEEFEISVFAGLRPRWLSATSPERALLRSLGVGRLILQVNPPYPLDEIRSAGAQLFQQQ
jgi:alkanesulfonate monooxygenase SsuD/methylene tetrahydromethanopterin reductase-like flavin-dependent oxidoreductase (luciferase family)